jgi:hypothetical protein
MKIPAEDIVKASFKVTNFFGVPKFLPTVEKTGFYYYIKGLGVSTLSS